MDGNLNCLMPGSFVVGVEWTGHLRSGSTNYDCIGWCTRHIDTPGTMMAAPARSILLFLHACAGHRRLIGFNAAEGIFSMSHRIALTKFTLLAYVVP